RKSPGSNPAHPRRHILVCARRNTAGANKFGTVRTARRMRERKPSRNCPLRGQSSNGSRRIVRRGLLVPDAEEPALFSRGLTKIRLTTPSWQDISDGNPHGESSFQFTWCSLEALDRKIPSSISTCIRKPRGGPRISRRII